MGIGPRSILANRSARWVAGAVVLTALAVAVLIPIIGSAATIEYRPSGVFSAGSWVTSPTAGQWATYLDSNDGTTTHAWVSSENNRLVMDLDNPSGMSGPISSVTLNAVVRDSAATRESYQLGMTLDGSTFTSGTAAQAPGAWTTVSYSSGTAPDGGSWDWTKIGNLKGAISHVRFAEAPAYVEATRSPNGTTTVAGFSTVATQMPMWAQVDEFPTPNDDTDYIQGTNVAGGAVNFLHPAFSLPSGATSISVHVFFRARDHTANANNIRATLRSGTTTYTAADINPPGTWTNYEQVWTTNPANASAPWTSADVNGTSGAPLSGFGLSSSDFSPNVLITQTYCIVRYENPTWEPTSRLMATEMYVTVEYEADTTPPTVTGATSVFDNIVDVSFDETLSAGSINSTYFTISDGLSVSAAVLNADQKSVRLTTSPQTHGWSYTVTVKSGAPTVTDLAGNAVVAPNNTAGFTGQGGVWVPTGTNVSVNATSAGIGFLFASVSAANWLHADPAVMSQGAPSGQVLSSGYHDITFDGTFSGDCTVTIPYNEGSVIGPEADLKVFRWTGAWTEMPTTVNTVANTASARTSSFSGWGVFSASGVGDSPHSGYTTTSRKCAVCHAVHEAESYPPSAPLNGELLLRSTVANSCDFCHVGSPFVATQVYVSSSTVAAANTGREHTIVYGSTNTSIPDSGDRSTPGTIALASDYVIPGGLKCTSCHTVHGANAVVFAGGKTDIIKANPWAGTVATAGSYFGSADASLSAGFCADCHDNNAVTTKDWRSGPDRVSHYMGSTTASDTATTASNSCRACHRGADGASGGATSSANNYPHYTIGRAFLASVTATDSKVDGVCLACHPNVGTSF